MIDALYRHLLEELQLALPRTGSSHMNKELMVNVEVELLQGKYVPQVPRNYPSGNGEKMGLRTLRASSDTAYLGTRIRAGTTTLHVRPENRSLNSQAVVLICLGKDPAYQTVAEPVKAVTVKDTAMVVLQDNGVVSAGYVLPPIAAVASWHPPGKEGFGGWPYSKRDSDVDAVLKRMLEPFGLQHQETLAIIPPLVMLAKKVYSRSKD